MPLARRLLLLPLLIFLALPALYAADKSQVIAERLKAAAELSSIDVPGLQPWHLKIEVTLFDDDGKNPQSDTVEVWSADASMKTVETVGTLQVTTVRNGDNLFRTDGEAPALAQLELLLQQAIHPIPDEFLQPDVLFNQEKSSIGKTQLDCILPKLPTPHTDVVLIRRQLSYCLKRNTDTLLLSDAPGDLANLRQQIGTFQSKEVPVDLKVFSGKTLRLEAKIVALETFVPKPDDFSPTNDMHPFAGPVEVKPQDLINVVLSKTPPSYPISARQRGVAGSVKFDAIIGTDGHILSMQPNGNADPDLLAAAAEAVHHWVYRPFVVCGIPVPVNTTITVNFNLNN